MEQQTAQQVYAEISVIRETLLRLQRDLDRIAMAVGGEQREPTRWLALAGVGAEVWRSVDVAAYINAERDSWT